MGFLAFDFGEGNARSDEIEGKKRGRVEYGRQQKAKD
jgi:hypothetical protein